MSSLKETGSLSIREQKAQQLKLTQLKEAAKDTKTKELYLQCLSEIKNEAGAKWNKAYDQ